MSKQVHVILVKDVKGLGKFGDEIKVKLGYANNFLVRQNMALLANSQNRNHFQAVKKKIEKKIEDERKDAMALKDQLDGKELTISMKAQENGKLYGSVNAGSIVDEFSKAHDISILKRQLSLPGAIKHIGEYTVDVNLPHSVDASFKLIIQALAEQD